jgi:predicted DNA-binding ribbon-helix-helix protein
MKSSVIKRSIDIVGRRTSVCLEEPFWSALKEIASARNTPLNQLVATIDAYRQQNNLSSAIRLFVLGVYRDHLSNCDKP